MALHRLRPVVVASTLSGEAALLSGTPGQGPRRGRDRRTARPGRRPRRARAQGLHQHHQHAARPARPHPFLASRSLRRRLVSGHRHRGRHPAGVARQARRGHGQHHRLRPRSRGHRRAGRQVRAGAARRARVLRLRLEGRTFEEIGRQLDPPRPVSRQRVHELYQQALDEIPRQPRRRARPARRRPGCRRVRRRQIAPAAPPRAVGCPGDLLGSCGGAWGVRLGRRPPGWSPGRRPRPATGPSGARPVPVEVSREEPSPPSAPRPGPAGPAHPATPGAAEGEHRPARPRGPRPGGRRAQARRRRRAHRRRPGRAWRAGPRGS